MRALFFKFSLIVIVLILVSPTTLYAWDAQSNNSAPTAQITQAKSPGLGVYDSTPQAPAPTATLSGTIQKLPAPTDDYSVQYFDPNSKAQYPIMLAGQCGLPFGLGPLGGACDLIDSFIDNFTKCGPNIGCWIAAGVEIVERTLFKQAGIGCDIDDSSCQQEREEEILNGEVSAHSGALLQLAALNGHLATMPLPISTDLYIASLNPFKQADAQGLSDLQQANGIFEIWKNVRNGAYALSIVTLVIVGFMIMFRTKLDPRTAVTLTNSIPKIVIMLVLITFSLAIAGLILDGARLLTHLLLTFIPDFGFGTILRLFISLMYLIMFPVLGGFAVGGLWGAAFGLGFGLLVGLIILIYLLYLMFKVFYLMITRYALFLLAVIFSPLIFLAYPFPKGGEYVSLWFKKMVAYAITIPIIVVLVEISFTVATTCVPSPFTAGVFSGPQTAFTTVANACQTGASGSGLNPLGFFSIIGPFVALGILSTTSKAAQIADDLVGNKPLGAHGGGRGGGGFLGLFFLPAKGLKNLSDMQKGVDSIGKLRNTYGPVVNRLPLFRRITGRGGGEDFDFGGGAGTPGGPGGGTGPGGGGGAGGRSRGRNFLRRGLLRVGGLAAPVINPALESPAVQALWSRFGRDSDISGESADNQNLIVQRRAYELLKNPDTRRRIEGDINAKEPELRDKSRVDFRTALGPGRTPTQVRATREAYNMVAQERGYRIQDFDYSSASTGGMVNGKIVWDRPAPTRPASNGTPSGPTSAGSPDSEAGRNADLDEDRR